MIEHDETTDNELKCEDCKYKAFIEMELEHAEAFGTLMHGCEKTNNLMFINRCRQVLEMPLLEEAPA